VSFSCFYVLFTHSDKNEEHRDCQRFRRCGMGPTSKFPILHLEIKKKCTNFLELQSSNITSWVLPSSPHTTKENLVKKLAVRPLRPLNMSRELTGFRQTRARRHSALCTATQTSIYQLSFRGSAYKGSIWTIQIAINVREYTHVFHHRRARNNDLNGKCNAKTLHREMQSHRCPSRLGIC
jgi:hypothetical protein